MQQRLKQMLYLALGLALLGTQVAITVEGTAVQECRTQALF